MGLLVSGVINYSFDADGNLTGLNCSNGVNSALGYDNAGRLTTISHDGPGGNLLFTNYTLDPNGNRVAVASNAGSESYTLDLLNRLTNVTYPNGDTAAYSYDANAGARWARLSQTLNGVTTNYSYDDAGQLLSDGTISYGYDANGNRISAGADSYSWDWANRLTGVAVGGISASYSYDAFDVRVSDTVSGTTSSYVWDRLPDNPVLLDDGVHAYLHGAGPQAQIDGSGNRHYLLRDALGSVRGVTDNSGALVGATEYDAFGAIRSQSGTSSNLGYTGEQYTAATGLLHLRARDLNPTLGRFLSADTVRPNAPGSQGYNLYAYVANNPTTWVDPSGHEVGADTIGYASTLEILQRMDQVASANGRLLGTALAGMLQATLILGRNVASWAFGQHRNTSITVLAVFALTLACAMRNGCMSYMTDASNLAVQAGSLAKAGVIAWGVYPLQQAAGLYPTMPRVARPTAITRPAGTLNGPLGPWLGACMTSGVINGVADLASDAYGYQGTAGENAAIALGVMYNVMSCGGAGGSSGGGSGGGGSNRNNPIIDLFSSYDRGTVFSGAFDESTGRFAFRPSTENRALANDPTTAWVYRRGGHATVASMLSTDWRGLYGFAIEYTDDAQLKIVSWRSGTLNPVTDNLEPPTHIKEIIVRSLREQTGLNVISP